MRFVNTEIRETIVSNLEWRILASGVWESRNKLNPTCVIKICALRVPYCSALTMGMLI